MIHTNSGNASSHGSETITIEPVTDPKDFIDLFRCTAEAFGTQTNDAIWASVNPGWDTPEGRIAGAQRLEKRWREVTQNKFGQPNTIFLKATVPEAEATQSGEDDDGKRGPNRKGKIVGMAIWYQVSFIPGYGDAPPSIEEPPLSLNLSEKQHRYATQMFTSLHARRRSLAQSKAQTHPHMPALFLLDMCAVDPAFQRRGVAGKLVQWGLNEAVRRGGLECATEASMMGRAVYLKKGFRMEGDEDIVYEVDEEFKEWHRPSNVFLRTGA
jgi:ribosomal protein S18 acetylase RimI-like enzyme